MCIGGAGSARFLSVEGLKAESGLNPDNNDTTDARHSQLCHPICELLSLLLILKPDKEFRQQPTRANTTQRCHIKTQLRLSLAWAFEADA